MGNTSSTDEKMAAMLPGKSDTEKMVIWAFIGVACAIPVSCLIIFIIEKISPSRISEEWPSIFAAKPTASTPATTAAATATTAVADTTKHISSIVSTAASPDFWKKAFDGSIDKMELPKEGLKFGIPVFLVGAAIICISFSVSVSMNRGAYTKETNSVNTLISVRNQKIQSDTRNITLPDAFKSVCSELIRSPRRELYSGVITSEYNHSALVNFRPLTVRLGGYLNGISSTSAGVFDMDNGIQTAIKFGARSFIFDINYDKASPCVPIIVNEQANGNFDSLNTASVSDAMTALNRYAFSNNNYDPVIIVLYIKRIPPGKKQQAAFFVAIARAMAPLTPNFLGTSSTGIKFHTCTSESQLFTSPITNYQKKFIVLSNHDPIMLPSVTSLTDNLHYWTNARLYRDTSVQGTAVGITPMVETSAIYATIGNAQALLNISAVRDSATNKSQQMVYEERNRNIYKIAICPLENVSSLFDIPDLSVTRNNLATLLNVMGINSVPLDVITLISKQCYANMNANTRAVIEGRTANLYDYTDRTNVLSYWALSGWSMRRLIDTAGFTDYNENSMREEGFVDKPKQEIVYATTFVIPKSIPPKKPNPSTNSNGGLVSIV